MKRLLSTSLVYFTIANIFIIASNLPLLLNIRENTPGYIYPLVHREATNDYYSYLAYITEGKYGFWLKRDPYTTEKTLQGILHVYYILAGKLAWLINADSATTYHIVRLISLELFIVSIFLLCKELNFKKLFLTTIFCLLVTIPPSFIYQYEIDITKYPGNFPWWISLDPLERLYMPPHHIFGQSMLLLAIVLFFQYLGKQKFPLIIICCLFLFLGSISFPPVVLPMMTSLPLAMFLYFKRNKVWRGAIFRGKIIALISILAICFLIVFLIKFQQNLGYPWSESKNYELGYWNNLSGFNYELLLSFIIPIVLITPVFIRERQTRDLKKLFLFAWAFMPFLLLPFSHFLSIPKVRLINATSFIPFALLSVHLFDYFRSQWFRRLTISIVVIFYLISLIEFNLAKYNSIIYYNTHNPINPFRIPKSVYDSLIFIKENLPKNSRILSSQETGIMIPAYAPVVSYIGHILETYNFGHKIEVTQKFYSGNLDRNTVEKILKENGIDFVLYGPYEKNIGGGGFSSYDFLEEIYRNQDVGIFTVKKF